MLCAVTMCFSRVQAELVSEGSSILHTGFDYGYESPYPVGGVHGALARYRDCRGDPSTIRTYIVIVPD
jgi:hypothetical protein